MTTLRRGLTSALVLVAIPLVLAAPAHADPGRVLVSRSADGPFLEHLPQPLFAEDGPFVPRDVATRTLYVKNASPGVARTTLAVVDRGSRSVFESALTFDVRIGDSRSRASLTPTGERACELVTTGPEIPPGGVQAVDIGLEVADLTGTSGMGEQVTLDLVLTLSEVSSGGRVDVCGDQSPTQPAADCRRAAVVSVSGGPTCVPEVVDAGRHEGAEAIPRSALGGAVGALLGTGLALVLWGGRRRRPRPTHCA
ncbi:MAG TPA: hypothetical protein VD814_08380 [Nocardioides sp.]|nr:hypothetical protein [Nocardioides sp.]